MTVGFTVTVIWALMISGSTVSVHMTESACEAARDLQVQEQAHTQRKEHVECRQRVRTVFTQ
jgi:hypothetical protein